MTPTAPPSHVANHRPTRFEQLGRLLVGCLVAEALVAAIALTVFLGARAEAGNDPTSAVDGSTAAVAVPVPAAPDDSDGFLRAWQRSLDVDHEATGTLTRTTLGRGALYSSVWPDPNDGDPSRSTATWSYHHVRSGDRRLTRIGDVATVVDPDQGHLTCMEEAESLVCSPVSGSDENDSAHAVEQTVRGATATYRIEAVEAGGIRADFPGLVADVDCWEARSLTDGADHRWGRRAQFCFHEPSGAVGFRRILGSTRVEVLVVDVVDAVAAETNLGP